MYVRIVLEQMQPIVSILVLFITVWTRFELNKFFNLDRDGAYIKTIILFQRIEYE